MTELETFLCDELELILAAAISAAEDVEDNADPSRALETQRQYALIVGIRNRATMALAKAGRPQP